MESGGWRVESVWCMLQGEGGRVYRVGREDVEDEDLHEEQEVLEHHRGPQRRKRRCRVYDSRCRV